MPSAEWYMLTVLVGFVAFEPVVDSLAPMA